MQVNFQWIGGATFTLSIGDLKIAVDPVLCPRGTVQDYFWFKSKRIEAPVYDENTFKDVDLWLITHNHEDHLDELGLAAISNDAQVISNNNSSRKLGEKGVKDLKVLDWGETQTYNLKGYEIKVEAVAAIHGVNPLSAFFAGKVNGYFIEIRKDEAQFCAYITGDTVYKKWIQKRLIGREIDLLVPNMGAAKAGSWIMTLTLNAKMLKKLIDELNPKRVIPVHFGTFEHYKEPVETIRKLNASCIQIVEVGGNTSIEI